MISSDLAFALNASGLAWNPTSGDRFLIHRGEFESEVFTLSDMTIEAHEHPTGTILGFNGTTEWALDSVALEDSLWLPREEQLRERLGDTFRSLRRIGTGVSTGSSTNTGTGASTGTGDGTSTGIDAGTGFEVEIDLAGEASTFAADDPADAYALALLAVISASALA